MTPTQQLAPPRRQRRGRASQFRPPRLLFFSLGLFAIAVAFALFSRLWSGEESPIKVRVPETLPDWIQEKPLPVNEWSRPGEGVEAVNGIVVHYVGNPGTSAEQNWGYFAGLADSHETYASSNFLVGLDGEILLCVPLGEVAYCSSQRNGDTISIEVCHPDDSGVFTQESYDALVKLVNWLRDFYELSPEQVIRHYDVTGKVCPKYYVDHPEAWEEFRAELAQR